MSFFFYFIFFVERGRDHSGPERERPFLTRRVTLSLSSLYVRHAINNSSVQSNVMYTRVRLHITLQSITAAGHTDITSFEQHKG